MTVPARFAVFAVLLAWLALPAAGQEDGTRQRLLANADTWAYQTARVQPQAVAASPFDVVVVDGVLDPLAGQDEGLTAEAIATMRQRPNNSRRLVLGYMDVGHARDTRYYWRQGWESAPPEWLLGERRGDEGRHHVAYWDPAWQARLLEGPDSVLGRLIEIGVDGVYLDGLAAHQRAAGQRNDPVGDMIDLVTSVGATASELGASEFLVMGEASSGVLRRRAFLEAVDAVAVESLLFGQYDGQVLRNPSQDISRFQALLSQAQALGNPVFLLEYPAETDQARYTVRAGRELGYVPYATVPAADQLVLDFNSDPRLRASQVETGTAREPRDSQPEQSWPPESAEQGGTGEAGGGTAPPETDGGNAGGGAGGAGGGGANDASAAPGGDNNVAGQEAAAGGGNAGAGGPAGDGATAGPDGPSDLDGMPEGDQALPDGAQALQDFMN